MNWKSTSLLLLLLVLVYPAALAVQIALDTGLGDGEFLDVLTNGRKRVLMEILVFDWIAATLTAALLFVAAFLVRQVSARHIALKWIFPALLATMVIAPALPFVPSLMGSLVAFSAIAVGVWSWRTAA